MKQEYVFKVKHGHKDDHDDIVVTEDGFNRCIVIYHKDKQVHVSNLYHPESMGVTTFKGHTFIAIGDQVAMKLDNNTILLDSLDIKALDLEFNKILSKFTKEEVEEWLRLDRLKNYGE